TRANQNNHITQGTRIKWGTERFFGFSFKVPSNFVVNRSASSDVLIWQLWQKTRNDSDAGSIGTPPLSLTLQSRHLESDSIPAGEERLKLRLDHSYNTNANPNPPQGNEIIDDLELVDIERGVWHDVLVRFTTSTPNSNFRLDNSGSVQLYTKKSSQSNWTNHGNNTNKQIGISDVQLNHRFDQNGNRIFTDVSTSDPNASNPLSGLTSKFGMYRPTYSSSPMIAWFDNVRSGFSFAEADPTLQTPFGGSVRDATNWVPAEAFDEGGQGVAYGDDGMRQGNGFRSSEDVDITNKGAAFNEVGGTGNGKTVGYTAAGEWLEYTVDLPAGNYDFKLRYSSGNDNPGDLRVKINNDPVGTITNIARTGPGNSGWNTFTTATLSDVNVAEGGQKVVRLEIVNSGNFDLDQFIFEPATAPTGNTVARLQAESFNGFGSNADDWRKKGGNTYAEVDSGDYYSTGSIASAPKLSRNLTGMQAGTYRINARMDTDGSGSNDSFWMRVNGGTWKLMTNGLQSESNDFAVYTTLTDNGGTVQEFTLTGGVNTIEIASREKDTKIDWIEFERV
ncbi:MAG: carbohydrate-binding protein, partial [Planctomycetota bacterium]